MKKISFKLKTFTLSILLLLTVFCLCGCTEVNFVTYHNEDGSISEYVYLIIDEQALAEHDYNVDAVKLEIQTNSHLEANALLEQYQSKLYNQLQGSLLTYKEYTTLYQGVKVIEEDWQGGDYAIGLNFANSTIYKKYYELLNNSTFNQNTKQKKILFYTKTYHYGTTNYGDYSIFARIYNYYSNTIFATISPQQATLNYSYSVDSRRIHSDADEINIDSNGNYVHTWKVNPNEPAREIYFYTITANRAVWVLTCVIIGLITCASLCIAGIISYNKNKQINAENNNENNDKNINKNIEK